MNRFFNLPVVGAVALLTILGAVALGWLWLRGGRIEPLPLAALLASGVPVVLPLAAALLFQGDDRAQWAIALWAITLFASMLPGAYLLNGGAGGPGGQWRFLLGYGLLWLLLLVGYALWLAPWAARVPPVPGALPVAEHRLRQRVLSLAQTAPAIEVEPSMTEPAQMTVTRHFRGGRRSIAVRLAFAAERHCVLAREMSLVRGDRPMDADEAQMRQGIQPRDGTHPDASMVFGASLAVTLPSAAARQALGLRIAGDQVELGEADGDPAQLPHLLAELVRQSGWTWQGCFSTGSGVPLMDS